MTGSEKFTWGIVLSTLGSLAVFGGLALSATLIGACLGLPMAVVGFPFMIWGIVWAYQGRMQKAQEIITAGIREGITSMQTASLLPRSTGPEAASRRPAELVQAVDFDSRPALPEAAALQSAEETNLKENQQPNDGSGDEILA